MLALWLNGRGGGGDAVDPKRLRDVLHAKYEKIAYFGLVPWFLLSLIRGLAGTLCLRGVPRCRRDPQMW